MEKNVQLFTEKKKCCACLACFNICPQNAIYIENDENGFSFPKIDEGKCIKCGLCQKVCAYHGESNFKESSMKVYAAISKNKELLQKSASGAIFATVAQKVLEENGVVYGCSNNTEKMTPEHIRIVRIDELEKLQGSKYVQSNIRDNYKQVKNDLDNNLKVLFSGTPCQIDALYNYLKTTNTNQERLYTIDIICHGVPSTQMFEDYISFYERKIDGKILSFKFRDKSAGSGLKGKIVYKDRNLKLKEKIIYSRLSSYYNLFLRGEIYRENCYECKYAKQERVGDITIGDYWGIENEHPEYLKQNGGIFENKSGISAILVNSEKGDNLINDVSEQLILLKSTLRQVSNKNKQLCSPTILPSTRNEILSIYAQKGYKGVEKYYNKRLGLKKYMYSVYYKLFKK